jgi:CBS domain containing-hemolysin-like protein
MSRLGLILLTILVVIVTGLFSGSETGIYRLSRLRLRLGVEMGKWSALLLADVMRDSSGLLLSLLVGTNIAQYVATNLVTKWFLEQVASERAAELYTMLVAAPVLFVFADLLPKNIFLHRADTLTFFTAPLLYVSHKILTWCGAVPLLRATARFCARLIGSPVSPRVAIASSQGHQVRAILWETKEEGLLSDIQTEMVDRIANIPSMRLSMVMVPLPRVHAVEIRTDRATLLNALTKRASTRLPVWQNTPSEIVGFIEVYDVLGSGEDFTSLEKFLQPIRSLDADTPITEAINIMRREQCKIVLVTRRRARREVPLGIVTMKDLVEELLGELAEW